MSFPGGTKVKELPPSARDIRDAGWILGWEDFLEEGMEPTPVLAWRIPMNTGAWRATVHSISQSQTQLK